MASRRTHSAELRGVLEACSKTAIEFVRLYYDRLDNRRFEIARLYIDNANFSWNGNGVNSADSIEGYLLELPSSRHNVTTLDAQPMLVASASDSLTYILMTAGTVKFDGMSLTCFSQTFVLTAQNDQWLIESDCYRLQ